MIDTTSDAPVGQPADPLPRVALDLHWSWNHSADEVWKKLDPELWEITANPWLILQASSSPRLARLFDPALRARV